ncbi:MAG: hemerythrin domain-containing protein [Bacteroidales bacterium]|jgi:regulator of cell morphogenesis and NO signaling|nr:hemerythrin domain-containing protein [Bacteroidales bacterium]MDD3272456.1 hemerythrin domain-containing protein [Bacteroidales bacterium]
MTSYITSDKKLSTIVEENYKILRVLKRLGIKPGFGNKSIKDVCISNIVSPELFIILVNMSLFRDFFPDVESLKALPTEQLINYLKKTHSEFILNDIPKVEILIKEIALKSDFQNSHSTIFINFFEEYKSELISHFEYEDSIVFPYISGVIDGKIYPGYSIEKFEENHTNIESKISDLKNILLKYFPSQNPHPALYDLVEDLYILQSEFESHAYLEDNLLVPHVEFLEKSNRTL